MTKLWHQSELGVRHQSKLSVRHQSKLSVRHQSKLSVRHQSKLSVRHRPKLSVRHRPKLSVRHRPKLSVRHQIEKGGRDKSSICPCRLLWCHNFRSLPPLKKPPHPAGDLNPFILEAVITFQQMRFQQHAGSLQRCPQRLVVHRRRPVHIP